LNCSNPLFKRSTASVTYRTNNQKIVGQFAITRKTNLHAHGRDAA
jgi:hypothetical protein